MSEFSTPPIPPPTGDVCPVCHAPLQGRPQFCPNCGASRAQFSGGASCWKALFSAFLGLLAVAFGGAGACFLVFASSAYGSGQNLQSYGTVAFCFVVSAICIWAIWALNRRRK